MEHFIDPPQKPINLNQVKYDLALIYTREKFHEAIINNHENLKQWNLYNGQSPIEDNEIGYIQKMFQFAYQSLEPLEADMDFYDFTYDIDSEDIGD